LIVPKIELDYFVDVPEPYYSAVFAAAKKIAPAIQKATGCTRISTLIMGFDVPHFHYHLVPTNTIADIRSTPQQATQEALKSMHQKIISFL